MYSSYRCSSCLYLYNHFFVALQLFARLSLLLFTSEPHSRIYAAQIILAFEYMHTLDLVYRDLKPENILIDHTGFLKVSTTKKECKITADFSDSLGPPLSRDSFCFFTLFSPKSVQDFNSFY